MSDFSGLELHHVAFGGRLTWRIVRWVGRIGFWKPTLMAGFCWLALAGVATAREVSLAASPVGHAVSVVCEGHLNGQCHTANDGTGQEVLAATAVPVTDITGWTVPLSWWLKAGAMICTIGAVTVGAIRLFTGGSRPDYRRRGTIRGGIKSDWHAGHADRRRYEKNMRRAGNLHARRRARRAAERGIVGDPRSVEQALLRHADPPKTVKGKRRARKAQRDSRKMADAELAAEWDFEQRRIRAAQSDVEVRKSTAQVIVEGKQVGDAMRVDAGGPADHVEAWRQVIEDPHPNDELPPAPPMVSAPSPNTPEQAKPVSHPAVETLKVLRDRLEADQYIVDQEALYERRRRLQYEWQRPEEPARFAYCQACRTDVPGDACVQCGAVPSHRGIR